MEDEREILDIENEIICDALSLTEQRSLIFHLLYALDAFDYDISLESLADNFGRGFGIIVPTESAVFQSTSAIAQQRKELDETIIPFIENWRLDRLGVPTRLILRMALWELIHTDTNHAVIINEAIELAQCFAEKDAYKFINGVLDQYVKQDSPKE